MTSSYAAACEAATTNQGLDPMVALLTDAGIAHEVEQTGGFTMVVTVTTPTGTVAITNDGPADDPYWIVGWFKGTTWHDGPEDEEPGEMLGVPTEDIVATIRDLSGTSC